MTDPQPPAAGTLAVWAGEESYLMQGAAQVTVVQIVASGSPGFA